MRKSLGTYMNKSQSTYRQIHSSRSSAILTSRKLTNKSFTRYPNGITLNPPKSKQSGLIILDQGNIVLNIKHNGFYRETLYCFNNMSYCYEVCNESKSGSFSQLLFYKYDSYLMLYTLKNQKQDGFQYTYDYLSYKMTKSYYKNNQLRQVIETCTLKPREAEQHPEFVDLFNKFLIFDFQVQGAKRLQISDTMTYFGEVKNEAPNGFGVILGLNERYIGCFRDGLLQGYGSIYFPNGDLCEGLYMEGQCNRCSKYTKQYGTIFFLDERITGEQEYSNIITEYKNRFTIDNHQYLNFSVSDIIMELKQNLDVLERKRITKIVPQIKSQMSNTSQSKFQTDKSLNLSPILQIPQQRQFRRIPSRISRQNSYTNQLQLNSRVTLQKLSLPKSSSRIQNIYYKHQTHSQYNQIQQQPKDPFFDSLRIQEVTEDTVAEEVKKNIPRSLDIQVMKERRGNQVCFVHEKEERLIGGFIMEMIKENDNDRENSQERGLGLGLGVVTDRIRKSRIFPGKKGRIDQVTFTF